MAKKIVFVQGSPRKNGNTRAMTGIVMASAEENGAQVTEIDTTELTFKVPGCLGCNKCQQKKEFGCTLNDGVADAVATIPEYDVVVLATPLYWWSYSAQLKIFVDRMYSLSKVADPENYRSALASKTLALIATAGGPFEDNLSLLEAQWKKPADFLGCTYASCLFPMTPPEPGALAQDPEACRKAAEFGQTLASI